MINSCVVSGDVLDKPRFIFPESEHPMTFFNLGLWLEGKRNAYITVGCVNGLAILAAKHLRPGSWVVASGWLLREKWIDLEGISGKYVTLKRKNWSSSQPTGLRGWRRPPWDLKKRSNPTDKAHPTDMNKASWASQRLVLPKSKV